MHATTKQWGRIFVWAEHLAGEVHPGDLEQALDLSGVNSKEPSLAGKVLGDIVRLVSESGDYVTVELSSHNGTHLRIKKRAFNSLPEVPRYVVGDVVRVASKGETVGALVSLICWHLKDAKYYYLVEVDGKRLKRRYYAAEMKSDKCGDS